MKRGTVRMILFNLAGAGIFVAVLWLIMARIQQPDFSPPDETRDWARVDYRETFAPVPVLPLPTLTESPAPALKVTRTATKLTIIYPEHDAPETRDQHEMFEPDAGGTVVLPGGNRLRLEAIAVIQNAVIDWGDKRYTDQKVGWLDPVTLEPLPPARTAGWPKKHHLRKNDPASLLLRVSNSGEAPLRWFAAQAFDDRTLAPAHSSSSFRTHAKDGVFQMRLLIWHRTPVRVAVNFAFGDPEFRELALVKNAEVRFGDTGMVRVIDSYPMRNNSSSWGGDTAGFSRAEYEFAPANPGKKERSLIFQVWPPHNQELIDFEITAESGDVRRSSAWGSEGLFSLNQQDHPEVKTARVRRFPRLGRAVFELPPLPGMTEVTNLLETPVPRATFSYGNDLRHFIERSAGVEWKAWGTQNLPGSAFPLTLEDFTPAEALKTYEDLAGKRLYFDNDTLSIRDEKPGSSGKLAQLKAWWKRSKPRWLP